MKACFLSALLLGASFLAVHAADEAKPYPLTTCVISGEKLGEMGAPYVFVTDGQEVKLCCPHCKAEFDQNKQANLDKIKAAAK